MSSFHSRTVLRTAASSGDMMPIYGRRPANMRRWHNALAKLRSGSYRPRILFVGDSKTVGAGAGTDANNTATTGAAARNLTKHFADRLAAAGIPVSRQSIFGSGALASTTAVSAYDPRRQLGSGWMLPGSIYFTLGCHSFNAPNGVTTPLAFAPAEAVDTVDVLFYRGSSIGKFTVSDGATLRVTIDANSSTLGYARQSVSLNNLTAGKTINIARTATRALGIHIAGLVAYDSAKPTVDSAKPTVEIANASWFGSKSADWTLTAYPWSPANAIAAYAPDLAVIALGANDMSSSGNVPVATFAANIQTLIDRAKPTGDIVLVIEAFGAAPNWGDGATQESYRQALISLGASNDCMVVDQAARFGSFSQVSGMGLFFDTIHETSAGYADQAQGLAGAILF